MLEDFHTPITEEESQAMDAMFYSNAEEQRNKLMAELRQKGKVVSPIGGPVWEGAVYCVAGLKWWENDFTRPTTVINRWRMTGGQLRTATRFTKDDGSLFFMPDSLTLEVLVRESSRWVVKAKGTVEDWHCEMNAEIACFARGTDQRIADEVAELLVRIRDAEDQAEHVALMALSSRCNSCNRPLKDEISKIIGFGPDCAKQSGIPHTLEFARQVEQHRAELAH